MKLPTFKKAIRRAVVAVLLAPVMVVGSIAASIAIYAHTSDSREADAAIVLGAAVANGVPTPVFEQRIRHAIALFERGTVRRLILTGGVGFGDTIAESEAARDYCLARGVPSSALLVELQSHSTEENLLNARELIEANGFGRVLIVSDPLHERRAVTIARDLGLDAYASPTPTTRYIGVRSQANFLARETYFYTRYLVRRTLGYNAAKLAVAAEHAQRKSVGTSETVARAR